MRIAVFSDVHGNLTALEAVLDDIASQGVDRLVCLGDLAVSGPQPGECVAAIREAGALCVHGNTDLAALCVANRVGDVGRYSVIDPKIIEWYVARLGAAGVDYLAGLPRTQVLEVDGQRLLFTHASVRDVKQTVQPGDAAERLAELFGDTDSDWLLVGHLHHPYLFRLGGRRVINPGAVSRSLDGNGRSSYVMLDTETGGVSFRRVGWDVDSVVAAARKCGYPEELAELERLLRTGAQ